MSRTRQQCIADAIAKRVMANTKCKFSRLHADALQEISMASTDNKASDSLASGATRKIGSAADGKTAAPPNSTTSRMGVSSQVNVGPVKKTDFKDLKTGEDFRGQAAPAVLPPQPAPRAETSEDENRGA